jgi:hypothetical protein
MNEEAMPTRKVSRPLKEEEAETRRTRLHVKEEAAVEHDDDVELVEHRVEDDDGLHPADVEGMLAVFPEKADEVLKNVRRKRPGTPKANET